MDKLLVTQRKALEDVEPNRILRWLLRKYFNWRGFACRSHCGECDGRCYASIEYRGVFDDSADAYWAANCKGGAVKPIPHNGVLPETTVAYRPEQVPQCEVADQYRKGMRIGRFVAVPIELVDEALFVSKQLGECTQGTCAEVQ